MVKTQTSPLPEFENPPVVEVAVMVQFDTPALGLPHILRWWCKVQNEFPGFEQVPPVPPAAESFENAKVAHPIVQFQLLDTPPVPRVFLKKAADTELIQVQQDRFGYSWRKLKVADDYPRYTAIRDSFNRQLIEFEKFLKDEHLEAMHPTLCEVTYVNHISSSGVWHGHSDLPTIIPSVTPKLTDDFLPAPEDVKFNARYVIGDYTKPSGRLYVAIEPRFLVADMTPIYLMQLTARGAPQQSGLAGILGMFDLGHEWIVRAFATLTSPEMHKAWGRKR